MNNPTGNHARAIVSCSGKFHAFALAEQLNKYNQLAGLYTTYAWQKNRLFRRLAGRVDKELIDPALMHTHIPLAVLFKTLRNEFVLNDWYDRAVARSIGSRNDYRVFIGWSGMSLNAIKSARKHGKITVLERGSSHICYQNAILQEEYRKFGLDFSIDERVIEKELKEYEACDYIAIPSSFVKTSFLEYGVDEQKLFMNPYGTSRHFQSLPPDTSEHPFRILYLGSLTIQKGLIYLFEALEALDIPHKNFEVWFVGHVSDDLNEVIARHQKPNWTFKGHVPHYDLPALISRCDVGIQPSLQEGMSMVIPQMLGCGIPVIASTNSGGKDIIREGETGFVVPVRDPESIAERILTLWQNPELLYRMKGAAAQSVVAGLTWDDYGKRYADFLNTLS